MRELNALCAKDLARERGGARSGHGWLAGLFVLVLPALAWGEGPDSGDTAWMLTSTALVLFMTIPGLALFYGGLDISQHNEQGYNMEF